SRSLPLGNGEAKLDALVGEPHERRALALVLLVLDLPAALLERTELAIGRLLQAGGRIGRGLAAHPVGESLERQPKAERALGERLAVGRAKFLAFGGRELHRVALAHDAREALAERRADQHLVARARVAPEDIAGESIAAVARCDAAEKLEVHGRRRLQFDVSARRGEERRGREHALHLRSRLIVLRSVSLSGALLSDSCQMRFASPRWPSIHSTSPRWAPISASGRPS